MIPLSSSRVYLFGIQYKNDFNIVNPDDLISSIKIVLDRHFVELGYKDITFITSYKDDIMRNEIHINKIYYKSRRIFDLNTSDEIRLKIEQVLNFMSDISYEQIQFVNDGFDKISSVGFFRNVEG